MYIINFSHPLTAEQATEIDAALGAPCKEIIVPVQIAFDRPLVEQARAIVDSVGWTPAAWQTEPFVVRLPALDAATAAVLAEIHGRAGHFPRIVTIRRKRGASDFAFWEIVDLQDLRDSARQARFVG